MSAFPIHPEELIPRQHPSECVAELEYDLESQQVICVFHKRGTYMYFDVPPDVFADWNTASSRGTYFNLYIRENYQYERVA